MGKDEPEPIRRKCVRCDGNGGWWDHGNGNDRPKRWIGCPVCQGSGDAPS